MDVVPLFCSMKWNNRVIDCCFCCIVLFEDMYLLGTYNIYGGRIVHKYVFHIYIVKDVSKVIDYFKVGLPYHGNVYFC